MQKVVVKRSEWLRGEGYERSMLYRPEDGKRCCIGFACNQLLGLTDEQIAGLRAVGHDALTDRRDTLIEVGLIDAPPTWAKSGAVGLGDAYEANDAIDDIDHLTRHPGETFEEARERTLQEIGAGLGIDFVFVD